MAKLFFSWLLLALVPLTAVTNRAHPFYTSVTEIEHNAKEKTLEITCRLFTDDLENTLKKNYNTRVDLFNDAYKNANVLITSYIEKNLKLLVNGSPVKFSFIGYERKNEACWCYFEATGIAQPAKLNIESGLLYDFTDKQFNMFHATVNGSRKSTRLTYPDTRAAFEW